MAVALFGSLGGYQRRWLTRDVVAGLTVWAVLVPEALAYASIAGVSPVVGLYAAPAALVLYAALGSSRHLVVGPMSATAALSATAVLDVAVNQRDIPALTAALAVTAGAAALVAGLLRLGFLSNFISEPVMKGFIIGIALTIIVGQLPKLFGVGGGDGDFFEKVWDLLADLGDTSLTTLGVGAASLVVVMGLKRFAPRVPGSLVAVALGVVAVKLLELDQHGVSIVGNIDPGLPHVGLPDIAAGDYGRLAGAGVGVMLVGFAEGLGAAKTYAAKSHYDIDADRELLGLGAANIGAGLTSGMVVNGSLSKTAVNGAAGARTQLSGLIVAVLTIVTLLLLTGLFEDLPEATLAAVVVAAVIELVDIPALQELRRAYTPRLRAIYGVAARPDLLAALAALFGVLLFDTLPGLFIGIGASMLLLVYRASHPHLAVLGQIGTGAFVDEDRNDASSPVPGIVVLRPEAGLFFANAEAVRDRVRAEVARSQPRAVILDAETVPFIDLTAVRMLDGLADDLAADGIRLAIARDVGQVRDIVGEAARSPGLRRTYPSVRAALTALTTDPA
ncbi:MAG TPA: SulP family inorganic anion transporter, partial [Acidimicrobiales bacterium]|nr:SulP family inorganic anion transporter [Acidimicrobiales bacterium]